MAGSQAPVEVFCSYAHRDNKLRDQLYTHLSILRHQGLITLWSDQVIEAGTDWQSVINSRINSASIILLLLSADYLASDYCYGIEMQRALQRHQEGQAFVIPILLRPLDWKYAPFAHLRILPSNAKPIVNWKNRDRAFVEVVAGIRQAIEEFTQRKAAAQRVAFPSIWHVPYARNSLFTGREEILSQLHSRLSAELQAISGPMGIGKTQIAVEYAYRFAGEYDAVLWAQADSASTLIASYVEIANLLNLPEREDQEQATIIEAVRRWLQEYERWLLIVDGANEAELVRDFLPFAPKGDILLITHTPLLADEIEVGPFTQEQAASFLLHRTRLLAAHESLEQAAPYDQEVALQLAREMGGSPLALDHVGAYIEETGSGLADYLRFFQEWRSRSLREETWQGDSFASTVINISWQISFQKLEQQNPAAADLLRLCAFLAPYDIPLELLSKGAHYLGGKLWPVASDPGQIAQAINALQASSLAASPDEQTFSLPPSIQTLTTDTLPADERDLWQQRAVLALDAAFPEVEPDSWAACERLLPHALHCFTWIEQLQIFHLQAARLLNQAALYLKARGRYAEAKPLYEQSLNIYVQLAGPQSPDSATSLNNMARLFVELNMQEEAGVLFRRALTIREQQLGPKHLSTAVTLNDLALLYADQGKYQEAGTHFQRSLAIWDGSLGPQHPHTQQVRHDYARLVQGGAQAGRPQGNSQSRQGGG